MVNEKDVTYKGRNDLRTILKTQAENWLKYFGKSFP